MLNLYNSSSNKEIYLLIEKYYNKGIEKNYTLGGIMNKPEKLNRGDKVALVSLSWGALGDDNFRHKYDIAKKRLLDEFGLELVDMPHALSGTDYVLNHPEDRAKDLMEAFSNPSYKAIFCAIGGNDTIRILPYIDFDVIRNNPKIFMGYSDTTINHFMMHKADLVSFYGPTVMCEFGEYVKMFDYTKDAVNRILFDNTPNFEIKPSPLWCNEFVSWDIKNINKEKHLIPDTHGYELLQGSGVVTGPLLGGCLEALPMAFNTPIWPNDWDGKILLLETSDDKPSPDEVYNILNTLGEMDIYNQIQGIIVGKPYEEMYYEEYKDVIKKVLKEFNKPDLPVLYNINIGHAFPNGILPLGTEVTIDFDNKRIFLSEQCLVDDKVKRI